MDLKSFFSNDFEQEYFEKYFFNEETDQFENYKESWEKVSYIPQLVKDISLLPQNISSIMVLGAGTGECINYLHINNFKAHGIEISNYAKEHCLPDVQKNIYWGSASAIYSDLYQRGQVFNLVHSSCLHYLDLEDIKTLLANIKNSCYYFSHFGGFKGFGENELDIKIKTLNSYSWWSSLFKELGFKPTETPYMWKT